MDIARQKMLDEVMAADFMLEDLELYLNTHPNDQRALCIYVNSVPKARWLRSNYERMYGPITATASYSYPWPWINSPWPWEWQ
ncbi:MAG: spore coat protein CotJB [Ruminiclostridium sp.]|nr:spore coat protein CotJB [Ruminiclostridium sp.]